MNKFKTAYKESSLISRPEELLGIKELDELIFKITAPDKIILIATDQILTQSINNHYLNLLISLPSASNNIADASATKLKIYVWIMAYL